MAVDIKTLRIGSHVEYDGKRMIIASVSGKIMNANNLTLIDQSTLTLYEKVNGYDVKPIPITPELLKELGFKCTDKGRIQSWWLDFFCLDHLDGKSHFNFGVIHLKYLHELESLYYMICGIELITD